MTHAALSLQAAMYSRLATSTDLTNLLGSDAIFDDVPKSQKLPYVVFAESIHNDWSTGSEDGMEHAVTLNVWSGQSGRKEALMIADAIIQAFHDLPKLIDDHALINFTHEFTEVAKDQDTELFLARINFRAVTEPNQ
jgi:hypothetical protein